MKNLILLCIRLYYIFENRTIKRQRKQKPIGKDPDSAHSLKRTTLPRGIQHTLVNKWIHFNVPTHAQGNISDWSDSMHE